MTTVLVSISIFSMSLEKTQGLVDGMDQDLTAHNVQFDVKLYYKSILV